MSALHPTSRLLRFDELSVTDLYALLRLRAEVFVVEQDCAYQDIDGLDGESLHLLYTFGDDLVAYARVLPPGLDFADASAIGRVVTAPAYRRRGLGRPLMREAVACCERLHPGHPIKLHAQTYLLAFYREFGFEPYGEEFLEDGLPHYFMERRSRSAESLP